MGPVEALLSKPSKWIQGSYALNADGERCHYLDPATCYCVGGAIKKAYPGDGDKQLKVVEALTIVIGIHNSFPSLYGWNDEEGRTYEEVITAVRKAGI